MEALRIFICDDIDYVVATSMAQAMKWYEENVGIEDADIRELKNYNTRFYLELGQASDLLDILDEEDDKEVSFVKKGDRYWQVYTFADMVNSIGAFTEPFIICSTEY